MSSVINAESFQLIYCYKILYTYSSQEIETSILYHVTFIFIKKIKYIFFMKIIPNIKRNEIFCNINILFACEDIRISKKKVVALK